MPEPGVARLSSPQWARFTGLGGLCRGSFCKTLVPHQICWWCVYIDGHQVRLAKGKKNKAEAVQKFKDLLLLREKNPAPASGHATVASVIDAYLRSTKKRYSERAYAERQRYLQQFAEGPTAGKVNDQDMPPFHLTSWLDCHPEWKSDWTLPKSSTSSNGRSTGPPSSGSLPANPFRGVTHQAGRPAVR